METLQHRERDAQVVPLNKWVALSNTYICRAALRQENEDLEFVATALRIPGLVVRGKSKEDAVRGLVEAFRSRRETMPQTPLRPISDLTGHDLLNAVDRCFVVTSVSPKPSDVSERLEAMTDEECSSLAQFIDQSSAVPALPLRLIPMQ